MIPIILLSLGAGAIAGAPAPPTGTEPVRQVWVISEGMTTLSISRAISVSRRPGKRTGDARRGRTGGLDSSGSVILPIEPGSQIVVTFANGAIEMIGGSIAHRGGLTFSGPAGVEVLDELVILPEGGMSLAALRATNSRLGDGDGLVLTETHLRLGPAEGRLVISTDEVRLTPRLAAALGVSQPAEGSIGGVLIEAKFERVDSDEPVLPGVLSQDDTPSAVAGVVGPDVIVLSLLEIGNYGVAQDPDTGEYISAFSVATTSCNIGDEPLLWIAETEQHPVIGQNMFRLGNRRFEQIGMSWLKHGFFALRGIQCGSCVDPCPEGGPCRAGSLLGVNCSDPYSAHLNGSQSVLGPRWQVNPFTGEFTYPFASPSLTPVIGRRLQVRNIDLDPNLNAGALYFVEGQYVTSDEPAFGNQHDNVSYRTVNIVPEDGEFCVPPGNVDGYCGLPTGSTQRQKPAIRAWKVADDSVVETDVWVPDEGLLILAAKAFEVGNGLWRYEYALQNISSDRAVGSFTVPLPVGAVLTNVGFHDVDYHSGEPFDRADWTHDVGLDGVTWATTSYDVDPNANALRWGTLYNFRFDATVGPGPTPTTTLTLGLFKPGDPAEVVVTTIGPAGLADCNGNGFTDVCDIECSDACPEPCGGSADCQGNGIPDECEPDCNNNLVADECDVLDETSEDCNGNSVPDECEPDCNENLVADECDVLDGTSEDCDSNGVPDECDPDCDGDTIPDTCETVIDTDQDCVLDCDDLCPGTTPPEACCCLQRCCFTSGICFPTGAMTPDECLALLGVLECAIEECRNGCLIGDSDGDGDLDLRDAHGFQNCYSGFAESAAFVTPSTECLLWFDFDADNDVDLDDYGRFFGAYLGPQDPGVCDDSSPPPPRMVSVPGGSFDMGDPFGEGTSDELPVHAVYLSPYYIDKYEVTNEQYAAALNWAYAQGGLITVTSGVVYKYGSGNNAPYCDTNSADADSRIHWDGGTFSVTLGKEDHPVLEVSWYGSVAFSNWRSAMEGKPLCYDLSTWTCNFDVAGYRLPTEAEWEKAAGWDPTQQRHFRFGEHTDGCGYDCLDGQRANYWSSDDPYETGAFPWPTPVGYYDGTNHDGYQTQNAKSYYGCYDMSGNAWEWCNDRYSDSYYSSSPGSNPTGATTGSSLVLRGGGWNKFPNLSRSALRDSHSPGGREFYNGFRCAASANCSISRTITRRVSARNQP